MLSKLAAIISSNLNNLCLITSTLTSLFTYITIKIVPVEN